MITLRYHNVWSIWTGCLWDNKSACTNPGRAELLFRFASHFQTENETRLTISYRHRNHSLATVLLDTWRYLIAYLMRFRRLWNYPSTNIRVKRSANNSPSNRRRPSHTLKQRSNLHSSVSYTHVAPVAVPVAVGRTDSVQILLSRPFPIIDYGIPGHTLPVLSTGLCACPWLGKTQISLSATSAILNDSSTFIAGSVCGSACSSNTHPDAVTSLITSSNHQSPATAEQFRSLAGSIYFRTTRESNNGRASICDLRD